MKKYLLILLAAMAFAACGDDNSQEANIDKEVPEEVAMQRIEAFFENAFSKNWGMDSFAFTYRHNEICVINSREELAAIYTGEEDIPDIDFSKYTLLIGHVITPDTGHTISRLELTEKDGQKTLYVYVHEWDSGLTVITPVLYWGLYPKFPQHQVNVVAMNENGEPLREMDLDK